MLVVHHLRNSIETAPAPFMLISLHTEKLFMLLFHSMAAFLVVWNFCDIDLLIFLKFAKLVCILFLYRFWETLQV